jgi:HAE1 family hydrophobic/amphiphilic exporter-1
MEKDMLETPGVRLVLSSAGGGFLGGVNQGNAYVRIAPHEERTLSFSKFWTELKKGNPFRAFRGNYTQQDVMVEVRRRLQRYAPMRIGVRNAQSFNFGTGGRTLPSQVMPTSSSSARKASVASLTQTRR